MNKAITTFIILIGFVQISFAQIQFVDSTQAYNYWAKRGVIEAIYAYMQDYEAIPKNLSEKEKTGKDNYFKTYINEIENADITKISSQYSDLSSFLLNPNYAWSGCEKTVLQPLYKLLIENKRPQADLNFLFSATRKSNDGNDIPINFIPDTKQNNLNKSNNWNSTKSSINKGYALALKNLQTIPAKENTKVEEDTENTIQQDKNASQSRRKVSTQIEWLKYIIWIGIFLLGLIIGCILIYLITKKNIQTIVGDNYDKYLRAEDSPFEHKRYLLGYLAVVSFLQKRKNELKNQSESSDKNSDHRINTLQQKINNLESEKKELLDENIKLGQQLEQLRHNKPTENSISSNNRISQAPPKPLKKIFFSMPESDGSFQISNGEPSNDGKKYFKIEFEENSNKGEVSYLSGERDKRAINRLESYLKPVCDIENVSNSATATKIELIKSGTVLLNNDSWIIEPNNKIRIKLY